MIPFLLQVVPERLLERLGGAEEERLHRPLRAAERRGHVAVGEAVDAREEERGALLRRQLADRGLQLARELAARRALLGRGRRRVGELRALAAVVLITPSLPDVDPKATLRAADLVQAEIGGDGEEPGREAALGPVAVAEAEDLHEDVLGHLLGAGLATDQPARVLEDARAELLEEILEARLVPRLEAEHQGHIGSAAAPAGTVAADVVVPSPSPIGSPGRFISPTLAGAMRGEILREGTVASQTRTHADTRPGTHDRPRSCACPGPFWRLPWGARSC